MEQDAREEIRIIREMLEKTKRATAETGTLFIVWGVLITLALIGDIVLGVLKLWRWEWLNWTAMTAVGWVYSVLYGIRKGKSAGVRTYVGTASRHIYFSCGMGFVLVGLVFPAIGVYSYEAIIVLIAAVTGILFFAVGGVSEWRMFKWLGLFWWTGAVAMGFVSSDSRIPIYTGLFLFGFLIPAFRMRSRYRRGLDL